MRFGRVLSLAEIRLWPHRLPESGEAVPQYEELFGTHARKPAREVGNSSYEDHV